MLFDSAGLHVQPAWDTRLFTPANAIELSELDALLMPHPPHVPGFVARDILRVSGERAWLIRRAMADMLTGHDVTDSLLPQLKMPVLVAWGAEDRIVPLEQGEKMHQLIPQSQLAVFAGCGHLAPLECAGAIGPEIVAFVEK
jgi:pimeloyl-ACP methyl ester carboxylesterase